MGGRLILASGLPTRICPLPCAVRSVLQPTSTVPANLASTSRSPRAGVLNSAWGRHQRVRQPTITTTEDPQERLRFLESGRQYVAADAAVGSYVSNNAGRRSHGRACGRQHTVWVRRDGNTQFKQAVSTR